MDFQLLKLFVLILTIKNGYFQICNETFKEVQRCPGNHDEYAKASKKCSSACRSNNTTYQYHCLRTADKKGLVEMCAVPKLIFDSCPMYDSKGKVIQMDISTYCNSSSNQRHYNSSDLFHCDATCFQLQKHAKGNTSPKPGNG
ncbi:uncharacterized protein LOC144623926 [Crassostrea virginica]